MEVDTDFWFGRSCYMDMHRGLRTISVALLGSLAGVCVLLGQTEVIPAGPAVPAKSDPALLLANVWNPSMDPTGWWMSEKYDGLRGFWDGRQLWTRNGNSISAPDYFLAVLPKAIALDGELWIGRGEFEEVVSTVRSGNPDERWKRVKFLVFDAPQAAGTFEQRMEFLKKTLPPGHPTVQQVAQERCAGKKHLLAELDRIVRLGGEGVMLRKPESQYEARRSPTLLKVKLHDDAEATVIAHVPGKGKLTGKVGALRVKTADGREFSVGTGFKDGEREAPPAVGTVITYRYRGLTDKGLPRFPSLLRVRRD